MPRVYRVTFENVSVSAPQDLFYLKGSTGKVLRLLRFVYGLTPTSLATAQSIQTRYRFLPVTVTVGSGGSSVTPALTDPGDAAASFTARTNDTVKATTSGTAITWGERGDHIYAPVDESCPRGLYWGLNQACVIELLSTVTGTCAFSGMCEVEETGL